MVVYGSLDWDDIGTTFHPPSRCAGISSGASPSVPGVDQGDDYESMLRLAHSLYSRLPGDWRSLYVKDISEGATEHTALRIEIRRITHELGVDVEDLGLIEDVDASSR